MSEGFGTLSGMGSTHDSIQLRGGLRSDRPGQACGTNGKQLHVDCGGCAVRGRACTDCVISVLLGVPDTVAEQPQRRAEPSRASLESELPVELDSVERAALDALAGSGLLPPLRLVHRSLAEEPEVFKGPLEVWP